jgi:hypothetical protein
LKIPRELDARLTLFFVDGPNKGDNIEQIFIARSRIASFRWHIYAGCVQRITRPAADFDKFYQLFIAFLSDKFTRGHIPAQAFDSFSIRAMAGRTGLGEQLLAMSGIAAGSRLGCRILTASAATRDQSQGDRTNKQ